MNCREFCGFPAHLESLIHETFSDLLALFSESETLTEIRRQRNGITFCGGNAIFDQLADGQSRRFARHKGQCRLEIRSAEA